MIEWEGSEAEHMSDWDEDDFYVKEYVRREILHVNPYKIAIEMKQWIPQSGGNISIHKMDDKWLLNSIRMMKDKRNSFNRDMEESRNDLIKMLEREKDRRSISYRINKGRGITKPIKNSKA